MALVVKNLPANARDVRGLVPGLGRSFGGGHGNPLQYSCLENPIDTHLAVTVHRVTQSWTRLKQLSTHTFKLRRRASQVVLVVVKDSPASAGDARDMGSIPGSARSSGVGNGKPL